MRRASSRGTSSIVVVGYAVRGHARRSARLLVLACLMLLPATAVAHAGAARSGQGTVSSSPLRSPIDGVQVRASRARTGTLKVKVMGLPHGVSARVLLTGPRGFRMQVQRSKVLKRLRPGRYRFRVGRVSIPRHTPGVPGGGTAYPTSGSVSSSVRVGGESVVIVNYGSIRNAKTHVLTSSPLSVAGDPTDPSAITVPGGGSLGVGSIVAQAPSTALPAGLFDSVTAVKSEHGRTALSLKPATLAEAFASIDVETSVPLDFGAPPATAADASAASALSDVDLSFSDELIKDKLEGSCGAPPVGWAFSPHGTVRPSLNTTLHKGFLGLVYGELSVTVTGDAGFDATIPSGVHCDLTVDGPKAQTFIPVAGVPVPVEGSVNLGISLALDGATEVHTDAKLSITGGVDLHGAYGTPILRVTPSASGSIKIAGGRVSIGPQVQVGLGLADINGHVSDSLDVIAKGSSSQSCEIDIGGSAGVGLDLWTFHPSFTPINPEVPVYHCPSSSQGGGSGSTEPTPKQPSEPPTPRGGSVLVYEGNESSPDNNGNDSYSELAKATGRQVEAATTLPSDLSPDACVLLQLNAEPFSPEQVAQLLAYMQRGGVLIGIGEFNEYDEAANQNLSSLAASLGASMAFEADTLDSEFHLATDLGPSPFANGVGSIEYAATASLSIDPPAEVIARTETEDAPFIGAQAIGSGSLVMIGDSDVLSDFSGDGYESAGNAVFARNLCGEGG